MTRPLIGIGCDVVPVTMGEGRERVYAYATYLDALEQAGASIVLIPPGSDGASSIVPVLDGIVLAGGDDCDPAAYGEPNLACGELLDARRERTDIGMARVARAQGIPLLGICLGSQIMNISAGGTLVQDIPTQVANPLVHTGSTGHRSRHVVRIDAASKLAKIIGADFVDVNSGHHQSIARAGDGLTVVAQAADGVVEAIEDAHHPFFIGVQWHPEEMTQERSAELLFGAFVRASLRFRGEKTT